MKIPTMTQPRSLNPTIAGKAGDFLPLMDFISVLLTGYCCLLTQVDLPGLRSLKITPANDLRHLIWIAAVIAPFILYDQSFVSSACAGRKTSLAQSFSGRLILFMGLIFTIAFSGRWLDQNTSIELTLWLIAAVSLMILSRISLALYLRGNVNPGHSLETIAVIGHGPLADHLVPILRDNAQLFGLFNDRALQSSSAFPASDLSVEDLMERAKTSKPDRIVIAQSDLAERKLLSLVERLRPLGIPVDLCPRQDGLALQPARIGHVGGTLPVALLIDRPIKNWNAVIKASEDIVLSLIAMIVLAPLLACIALAIKLDSPGPILFTQRRHGYKSTEFDIYKFRTMYFTDDSRKTELRQTLRGDHRVTRVGRFLRKSSLDELPQIINVLRGSMSLVGPRPHAVDMRTSGQLGHEVIDVYLHRHSVKPGITGWSQANGCRGATDTAAQLRRRIELDLHYVENWSLLLDLKILLMTLREVLRTRNAY